MDEIAEPDDAETQAVIDRYARAFEAADVEALVRLLTDDAILEMPPVPLWFRGSEDYGRFVHRVFEMRGAYWSVRGLAANGQPALAAYTPDRQLHTLQVFTVAAWADFAQRRVRRSARFQGVRPAAEDFLTFADEFARRRR